MQDISASFWLSMKVALARADARLGRVLNSGVTRLDASSAAIEKDVSNKELPRQLHIAW